MNLLEWLVTRRRLILTLAALLSISGVFQWITMTRQEDPRLPDYWGQVTVIFPGADAETVERLVLRPLEDALAEVAEVKHVHSTAYAEFASMAIELDDATRDFPRAWDDVREALDRARPDLPSGALPPQLNDEVTGEQESVVLAVTGSTDPVALRDAARDLKDALLAVPEVAKVYVVADPGEQVTVRLDDGASLALGLSPQAVAAQLAERDRVLSGGSLAVGGKTVRLSPRSDFASTEEIAATPVALPGGGAAPLSAVAQVTRGPSEPAPARMRVDDRMAVGLGVVPKSGVNVIAFGDAVRRAVDRARPSIAPLAVSEVAFQPERVALRLSQLGSSLLQGIAVVAGIVILFMGLRLGLVVASIVPLVAAASLAVYAMGGGVLQQISIAALVLSLGMLVDNAIVVGENVQWRLDRGASGRKAAQGAVRELAAPLAGATATTLAAFVPMLISSGVTAEFTRSIPVVVMLTLTMSYIYALFVTPAISMAVLRPGKSQVTHLTEGLGRRAARVALGHPRRVLILAVIAVALSVAGAPFVRQQFFPASDRNQFVIDVRLDEGSHLDATDVVSRKLERALLTRPEVTSVASFMGRSAPHFYYNLPRVPWSPHFAQLIVDTRRLGDVDPLLDWTRDWAARELVGAEIVARKLEQGPPVGAPIEVRLTGPSLEDLHAAALEVEHVVRGTPGAVDVRRDLGPGEPTLRFAVDDAAAARFGLSRADVAGSLYGRVRGLPVGDLRSGRDPVPIVVVDPAGEWIAPADLASLPVSGRGADAVPLAQVARASTSWGPAAIHHRDRERVTLVSAQLETGETYSQVMRRLAPRLSAVALPADVKLGFGGESEGSGEANASLLRALPIGLMLLFGVLLAEFNSFRRLGIILTTVPLAAAGVIPGLLIANQPFGFTSMLGVIALVGIVVNNAILLLEVTESRRREGAGVDEALADAIAQRVRPILLTTGTTVAGLLPLALSPSTLWPPLAWAMISGLSVSTFLTLVVVPALYRALFGRGGAPRPAKAAAAGAAGGAASAGAVALLAGLALSGWLAAAPAAARAQEPSPTPVTYETGSAVTTERVSLADALARARQRPAARAAEEGARAAAAAARAEKRAAFLPVLAAGGSVSKRDRDLELVTPIGNFQFGARRVTSAGAQITQPLFDLGRQVYAGSAASAEARAARYAGLRDQDRLAAEAGDAYLDLLAIEAQAEATLAYITSLSARLDEVTAVMEEGRALEADVLKIRLALERAQQDSVALAEARRVASGALARTVGATGEIDAEPAPDWSAMEAPAEDDAVSKAAAARPDLAALDATVTALAKRRDATRAEMLPRLEARGTWSYSDGSPYSETSWLEGAVAITWVPFAAGTTTSRAQAVEAQRRAAAEELIEARRRVALEVSGALASLTTARHAVNVSALAVDQAAEALRVELERHQAGRATTNDLLAAEAAVREQETRLSLARLDVVRAWIGLWLAGGTAKLPL